MPEILSSSSNAGVSNELISRHTYCIVIPVFNSEKIIGETLKRTQAVCRNNNLNYTIVAVNDGSSDRSWQVIRNAAEEDKNIIAIDLGHNYGQHAALLCGLRHSDADYTITIDDDLQNPPELIMQLITKAVGGNHDFVCGRYLNKKHAIYRQLGSRIIQMLNERVFAKPKDFALTNFRLMDRRLTQRICQYKTAFPYINGIAVNNASRMANVDVEHHERKEGKSNYSLTRIIKLVLTILFNYSSFPLKFVCTVGFIVSTVSFWFGIFLIFKAMLGNTHVPGWTSLMVLMSFYNGLFAMMFAMVGEYLIRIINTTSNESSYHVRETMNYDS